MKEEVAALESHFYQVVIFSAEEIALSFERWKMAILGKFLGKVFPLDFV